MIAHDHAKRAGNRQDAGMIRMICLTLLSLGLTTAAHAGVRVYECRDAHGRTTLRDTPCTAKETLAGTREMLRPRDPPRATVLAPAVVRGVNTPHETIVRVVREPAPLYACTTAEGAQYLSNSSQGDARSQPVFYPVMRVPVLVDTGGTQIAYRNRHLNLRIGGRQRMVMNGGTLLSAYGTWVQDACSPVSAEAACEFIQQQREAVRRRNVAQQQSERERLYREEAVLTARLADCGP